MSGTMTRLVAALIGLGIILPALFLGGPAGTAVVVAVAMLVALEEYTRMAFPSGPRVALAAMILPVGAVLLPAVMGATLGPTVAAAALCVIGAGVAVTLFPGEDMDRAADRLGRVLVGVAWIGLLSFLVRLRSLDDGVALVMLALGISWAADTGAYFTGRRFGRTKLYPRVSPNKTWEGLVGGVAGSVAWVLAVEAVGMSSIHLLDVLVMAPVASVAGVLGDLTESMLKRSHGVKDTGNILPGHGGILDRIDSVLFVAPVVWSWHVGIYGV